MILADHAWYLWGFLAGLAASLGGGAALYRRSKGKRPAAERLALLVCPAAVYVAAVLTVFRIARTPEQDWNSARLAPTVAMLHGAKLYVSPRGNGAVMNTIYPPMSYVAYLPTAIFSRPTSAILAGSSLSWLMVALPAFWLCAAKGRARDARWPSLCAVGVMLVFAQAMLTSVPMLMPAFHVHADAPMHGFMAASCLALYLGREGGQTSARAAAASALFASLAVWSKQTAAPMVALLPVWVAAADGTKAGRRYLAWLSGFLLGCAVVFRAFFGTSSFFFNVFRIPSRHPWYYQGPDFVRGVVLLSAEYLSCCLLPAGLLATAVVARKLLAPEPSEERTPGGLRAVLRQNPWLLFALTAAASVPTSFLSRIKVGGTWNNYGPTVYFLTLALCALLLEWHASNRRLGRVRLDAALTLALFVSYASPLASLGERNFDDFNYAHRPSRNPQEEAYRFAKRHPSTAYFPWNPLSTLLAEGRLDHFEYGLADRELAGFRVPDAQFWKHVPPGMRYVCFPPLRQDEYTMKYLPEFTRRVEVPGLPGWICYERGPEVASGKRLEEGNSPPSVRK
jgi:hypothetical protein